MAIALSIIVPVYNVERFLEQALASLSLDDATPYEVLLINDGSTDGSLDICRRFAAHHPQVMVIDQPNKGYGAACNAGLDRAGGEYVAIFEPDDLLGEGFYAALLEAAEHGKPDIVRYNGFHTFSEGVYSTKSANFSSYCGRVLRKEDIQSLWASHPCIWNGIYRRQMLTDAQVRFTEGPGASFQDAQFLISLYYSCSSVLIIDARRYYYRHHVSQSISNADTKVDAILTNMKQQLAWFQSRRLDDASYMIYASFKQFRVLYDSRLRTSDAKRKLLAGFRELNRVHGISRLTYTGATMRIRILYRLLAVYGFVASYYLCWERKAESLLNRCKSKWHSLHARLASRPDGSNTSGPVNALLFEQAVKNSLTAAPAPSPNSSALWNEVLPRLSRFLVTEETPVPLEALLPHARFIVGAGHLAALSPPADPQALIFWSRTPKHAASINLLEYAAIHKLPVIFADEGPLSSIAPDAWEQNDTGAKSPLSFLLDRRGSCIDAAQPSMLEDLLNSDRELTPDEYRRASALMQRIVSEFSSDASHQQARLNPTLSKRESTVLVVEQADDIPIMESLDTFNAMLEAAIAENPDANIIVAMRPDSMQDIQTGNSRHGSCRRRFANNRNITCVTAGTNLWPLIGASGKIYVHSSPMGLAALMAKKTTVIYGAPFYAGWGVGDVRNHDSVLQRRKKKRSIEEIFYLACIESTRYVNPHSMRPCDIEEFLQLLGNND